jgi:hypothetical protein
METIIGFLTVLLFLAFPVGIIVLAFVISIMAKQALASAWGAFARQAGLTLNYTGWRSSPSVTGSYKGHNVYLYTYTQGSGKNKTTYTSFIAYTGIANRAQLRVSKEGFLSKIGKALGFQDIQVGDREFDEAFIVKSATPDLLPHILTPQIRRTMVQGKHYLNLSISQGSVIFSMVGIEKNIENLRYILEFLVMVAQRVIEVEAPQQTWQARQEAAAQAARQFIPISMCQNCGGELEWQVSGASGIMKCPYCGMTMTFKMGGGAFSR